MADEHSRELERAAATGGQEARDQLARARCRSGDHSMLWNELTYVCEGCGITMREIFTRMSPAASIALIKMRLQADDVPEL